MKVETVELIYGINKKKSIYVQLKKKQTVVFHIFINFLFSYIKIKNNHTIHLFYYFKHIFFYNIYTLHCELTPIFL